MKLIEIKHKEKKMLEMGETKYRKFIGKSLEFYQKNICIWYKGLCFVESWCSLRGAEGVLGGLRRIFWHYFVTWLGDRWLLGQIIGTNA